MRTCIYIISLERKKKNLFRSQKGRTIYNTNDIISGCVITKNVYYIIFPYNSVHLFFFFGTFCGCSTARIASSNTVFSPFCVSAEHSRYLTALTSFCIDKPWGYVMGASLFSFSFSVVSLSSRKSSFVPTRMMGVFGQWWLTSGYHCGGGGGGGTESKGRVRGAVYKHNHRE